jgi:hypothetical protein
MEAGTRGPSSLGPRARQSIHIGQRGSARAGTPHDCPSEVDQKQLDELHLEIKYPQKEE